MGNTKENLKKMGLAFILAIIASVLYFSCILAKDTNILTLVYLLTMIFLPIYILGIKKRKGDERDVIVMAGSVAVTEVIVAVFDLIKMHKVIQDHTSKRYNGTPLDTYFYNPIVRVIAAVTLVVGLIVLLMAKKKSNYKPAKIIFVVTFLLQTGAAVFNMIMRLVVLANNSSAMKILNDEYKFSWRISSIGHCLIGFGTVLAWAAIMICVFNLPIENERNASYEEDRRIRNFRFKFIAIAAAVFGVVIGVFSFIGVGYNPDNNKTVDTTCVVEGCFNKRKGMSDMCEYHAKMYDTIWDLEDAIEKEKNK